MSTSPTLTQETATIVLVGNPNTGKSSVFNALCGTRQIVGNYPGVTVEKRSGRLRIADNVAELIDLPGVYSLNPKSPDEAIAIDVLMNREEGVAKADLVLFVMDATNLKRNLFLFSQVAELGLPTIVVLTMTDLLERSGMTIDEEALSKTLSVPVVSVVGRRREHIARLLEAVAGGGIVPQVALSFPAELDQAADRLGDLLETETVLSRFERRNLLLEHGHAPYLNLNEQSTQHIEDVYQSLTSEARITHAAEAQIRYGWANQVVDTVEHRAEHRKDWSERLDAVLLHRLFGPIIFAGIMFAVFQSIYTWAGPFMDLIDAGFGALGDLAGSALSDLPLFQSLVTDGVIAGVGGVVIFLPQIVILFLFVAVLEDSGYLARSAFLMDKLMSWTGLNGRAFIPMLSGFACAVPAIMSARVMPDPKARMATILVTPLVSCSARLPVYLLLISTFIEPQFGALWAAVALFSMHAFGLILALIIAWLLNRKVLKSEALPFVMELPSYRMPSLYNVTHRAGRAGWVFIKQAGAIIFVCSVIIWALSYFPRHERVAQEVRQGYQPQLEAVAAVADEVARTEQLEALETQIEIDTNSAYLEDSYLGRLGKGVQPIFAPLGFDWKISVGILGAFPAREVIISTLGIVYALGDVDESSSDLKTRLQNERHEDGRPVFTPLVAITLMIFFALCSQCMSTLATVKRELNSWGWTGFLFVYMTALAYIFSLIFYQGGRLLGFS